MKYFLCTLSVLVLVCLAPLAYADVSVCFSPSGGCQDVVISQIHKAHDTIDIAMYSFTSREIAHALLEAHDRGVKIRIVFDSAQIKDHFSKSRFLIKKDVESRFHLGPGLMHNKFAVIDDQTVLTGSYNWTVSADKKNAENLLTITDKELAEKYTKEFKHLWSQSGEGGFKEDPSESKE